jgi:hypothetical protein
VLVRFIGWPLVRARSGKRFPLPRPAMRSETPQRWRAGLSVSELDPPKAQRVSPKPTSKIKSRFNSPLAQPAGHSSGPVSSAITASVFMVPNSFTIVAKMSELGAFQDGQGKHRGHRRASTAAGVPGRVMGGEKPGIRLVQAVLPASMVRTDPVILRPPSPSRYSTMRATSSGSGRRRKALRPAMRLR